ncbi:MAG: hypothetical protein PF590_07870 [Candidatus Delongbacteria bacterium]|jgi:hypothetical protein|nr:hypothetical protein [Candidatus Delongbacteria bacterium]
MKKLSVIIAVLVAFTSVVAQEDGKNIELKPWSMGLNVGLHGFMNPINENVAPEIYDPGFAQLSGRYMFNDNWGIMVY